MLDGNGTIVEANLAAAAILGHERPRLLGKPLAALIELDDRRHFRHAFGGLDSSDPISRELRVLGQDAPWCVTLRVLPRVKPRAVAVSLTREGGPVAVVQAPRRGPRLEHFALRLPFGVVGIGQDLRVVFANTRARQLLGRDLVRTGHSLGDGAPDGLRAVAVRLVETPAPLRTTPLDLPDGRRFAVSGLPRTSTDPALLFLEDATDQHRHDQVMRDFLRNAAHQLRTPLAGIAAAVETLQSGAKDDPAIRDVFLGHLEAYAERLSRIARGLLLLARAESGEVVAVDFVELQPLIDDVVDTADARDGVEVIADCAPGLAALASPDLLHEAVAELVENALRHTLEGEVRITAAERGGQVALAVSDSGPGILPEFQDRVFEPFFQASAAGEGFGLGLAIAAQAVRTMHGRIEVSSAPGAGTIFTVTLPSATVMS